MGNGLSNARYMALGSFIVNFGTQVYGMITTPNMKDVANAVSILTDEAAAKLIQVPPSTTSRSPRTPGSSPRSSLAKPFYRLIGLGSYSPLAVKIIRCFKTTEPPGPMEEMSNKRLLKKRPHKLQCSMPPYMRSETFASVCFCFGHIVEDRLVYAFWIAGWLGFWLRRNFTASQILVTINTAFQLFAVARLPTLTLSSPRLLLITHLVAKTFAGIAVLDFLDNGGVALVSRIFAIGDSYVDIFNT